MILVNRFFIYFIFYCLIIGCSKNQNTYIIKGFTQGTTYNIKYHHNKPIKDFVVDSLLKVIDVSMSTYNKNSSISLINQGYNITLDPLIEQVIERSIQICHQTSGMFDITVAPLVNYWGFGPDKTKKKKSYDFIQSDYVIGCDKIAIKNKKLIKSDSVLIDLNGIAQGFTSDYIAKYFFLEEGVKDFMIEIGGEIHCRGNNLGNGWKIGIDSPNNKKSEFAFVLNLNNISLATSGSYRNYYYNDSVKINHTISPKTLEPTSNKLLSTTILHSNCMSADAYATACMALGLEQSKVFLQENNIVGCLIYIENQDTLSYFSPGFSSFLH
tara:strand:+ start:6047 stop:7024 length:978 start_codon:yes stop_codon:yes gene_type:complete